MQVEQQTDLRSDGHRRNYCIQYKSNAGWTVLPCPPVAGSRQKGQSFAGAESAYRKAVSFSGGFPGFTARSVPVQTGIVKCPDAVSNPFNP